VAFDPDNSRLQIPTTCKQTGRRQREQAVDAAVIDPCSLLAVTIVMV
jgi:hypothetical protein